MSQAPQTDANLKCPCGFIAKSKAGLASHRRACEIAKQAPKAVEEMPADSPAAEAAALEAEADAILEGAEMDDDASHDESDALAEAADVRSDRSLIAPEQPKKTPGRFKQQETPPPAAVAAGECTRRIVETVCRFALEMRLGRPSLNEKTGDRTWVSDNGDEILLDADGNLRRVRRTIGPPLEI